MTESDSLRARIEAAWDVRDTLTPANTDTAADVDAVIAALDAGAVRVAERGDDGAWRTHEWLKKAILLSFRTQEMRLFDDQARDARYWDKVPLKTAGWSQADFERAGFRCVPPATVRRGAYVAPGAVLMPSYVNVGAHVGEGAMIDTWATVGSCAQIGKGVHLSGGAGIGGVLEPLQATPTIIEDHAFIGARSEVAEGVIVREGAVLAMGVFISQSTKIVERATGAVTYGEVPAGAVVVPGALPASDGGPSLACAVIVKRVDARTRAKTSLNELLRD